MNWGMRYFERRCISKENYKNNVLGDAGISGTAQYMSQLVWVLFLVFDYKEEEWELEGNYRSVIPAPLDSETQLTQGKKMGQRIILIESLVINWIDFENNIFFERTETEYKGKTHSI